VEKAILKLSVVITTFNRAHVLKQNLDAFCNQSDRDFEVVVSMDGCTDNTETMLMAYKAKAPFELRWVDTGESDKYCLSKARNIGILATTGLAVVILDDDGFPVIDFVKEHKRMLQPKTLTGGYRNSHGPGDELHAKMQRLMGGGGRLPGVVENNCCMYRRDWIGCGLFSERIEGYGGTGQEFLRRLAYQGFQYQFNPKAMIYHHREFEEDYGLTRAEKRRQYVKNKSLLAKYGYSGAIVADPA
jgi:glycosyltransferase involved in cell wall biosynthesis